MLVRERCVAGTSRSKVLILEGPRALQRHAAKCCCRKVVKFPPKSLTMSPWHAIFETCEFLQDYSVAGTPNEQGDSCTAACTEPLSERPGINMVSALRCTLHTPQWRPP